MIPEEDTTAWMLFRGWGVIVIVCGAVPPLLWMYFR